MAKISLRTYDREIEGLIEQGQRLGEAIAHCRHILKTYPKHLETYRLLGKAYLEAKRYDQAVDIFQRVLVAAPEDFVAHVGMSIIADDKGRLDDAIWHMERAFEVQPSNAAIQSELQRLFGRRDGVEPPKIRLTRGALAHMYVQGELFPQAISEIRSVLSNDPKRTDMQTLLARAYFRNGQKPEATDICNELLGKYPYCLDANRLMVEIVPGTQRADTAQQYRQRVIELDPYAAHVQDSLFRSDLVADNLVTLDRLEYTGAAAEIPAELGIGLEPESMPAGRVPSLPAQVPSAAGAATPADLPAWLKSGADESAAQASAAAAAPAAAGEPDIPEFLRKAGWGAAAAGAVETASAIQPESAAEAAGPAAIEGELPEWVKALAPTEEAATPPASTPAAPEPDLFASKAPEAAQPPAAETPDWLRELDEEAPSPATPAVPVTPSALSEAPTLPPDAPDWLRDLGPASATSTAPPSAEPAEETPDWLKDLGGRELDEPTAPPAKESEIDWLSSLRAEGMPAAPAEESPDWLKEFSNDLETPIIKPTPPAPPEAAAEAMPIAPEPVTPPAVAPEPASSLGSLGTSVQEQDDAMAWLESLAAKHGAKPEELVTDPNARTDVAPEWVDKAKEIGAQAPETMPAEDETGMWLRSLAADAGTPPQATEPAPESPAEEEKLFDFRSFQEQAGLAAPEPEPAEEEPPLTEEGGTPDWLREFAAKPTSPARPGMEDAPDWLRGVSRDEAESEPPMISMRAEAEVPTAPLPREPEPEPPMSIEQPPAAEAAAELPAWLAGLETEEPSMSSSSAAGGSQDELPAWLQAEAEPEPEAIQPANPADWHPAEAKPAAAEEPEPAPAEIPPQAAEVQPPPRNVEPQVMEVQPPVQEVATGPVEPVPAPAPVPAPEPVRVETAPAPAPRPRPAVPPKPAAVSLGDAQFQLGRGNISAALDIYGKLIRKGKSLEDIIRDLREALYRYPVEVPLWQSLGDAYMRANRLQEALDAYTKAEELLR